MYKRQLFIDNETYIKVLNIYRLIIDNKINEEEGSLLISKLGLNIEDGFKFEDTIYQKELIKCQ